MLSPLFSIATLATRGLGLLIVDQEVRGSWPRVGTIFSTTYGLLAHCGAPDLGDQGSRNVARTLSQKEGV